MAALGGARRGTQCGYWREDKNISRKNTRRCCFKNREKRFFKDYNKELKQKKTAPTKNEAVFFFTFQLLFGFFFVGVAKSFLRLFILSLFLHAVSGRVV